MDIPDNVREAVIRRLNEGDYNVVSLKKSRTQCRLVLAHSYHPHSK